MKRIAVVFGVIVIALVLPLLAAPQPVLGQGPDTCPAFVEDALASLDFNCEGTGRNEVCYGNRALTAEFWEAVADDVFAEPADIVQAAIVRAISGTGLDLDTETWGLGLIRLQADIPETQPGQLVNFLIIGDVEMQNEVPPGEARDPVDPVTVTTTAAANLRVGPGTNFSVLSSVAEGQELGVLGVSEDGQWLQVAPEGQRLWLFAELATPAGDLDTLPVLAGDPVLGPMQAFIFETGFGDPVCNEAPPDHIFVESPEGLSVSFNANGVNFEIASSGALRSENGSFMTVTVFSGEFELTYTLEDGTEVTTIIPAGFEGDVPLDENGKPSGPPENLRPLEPEDWEPYSDIIEAPGGSSGSITTTSGGSTGSTGGQNTGGQTGGGSTGTTTTTQTGSGSLTATLSWAGAADYDLAVTEPDGSTAYYGGASSGGGALDTDANYPCFENPVGQENISWPVGSAPPGQYSATVSLFDSCEETPGPWTLTITANGQTVLGVGGTGGASFNFTVP